MKANLIFNTIGFYVALGIYIIIVILFPGKFIDVTPIPAKIETAGNKATSKLFFRVKSKNLSGAIVRIESSESISCNAHFRVMESTNNTILLQQVKKVVTNEQYKFKFFPISNSLNTMYYVTAEFNKPMSGKLKVYPLYRISVLEAIPMILNNHIFNRPFPFNMKGTHLILAGSYIFYTFLIARIILFLRD